MVSHDFDMGDWKPDRLTTVQKNIYLWVVPARVAGTWRTEVALPVGARSYQIEINQKYQEIDGVARTPERAYPYPLWEAGLRGDRVRFVIVDGDMSHRFEGRVSGDTIEGTVRSGAGSAQTETAFQARRIGGKPR